MQPVGAQHSQPSTHRKADLPFLFMTTNSYPLYDRPGCTAKRRLETISVYSSTRSRPEPKGLNPLLMAQGIRRAPYSKQPQQDTEIASMVTSSFAQYLDITGCSPHMQQIALTSVYDLVAMQSDSIGTRQLTSSRNTRLANGAIPGTSIDAKLMFPPASINTSSPSARHPHRKSARWPKRRSGSSIPISVIAILAFIMFGPKRYHKIKRETPSSHEQSFLETEQPYFQHKSELEAEEKAKYEVDATATERKYELDGVDNIREMSTTANIPGRMNPNQQELQGEVRCSELRAGEHAGKMH
ncbi:MAG: hypothetical protein Q9170_003036 [Blastenia crenularia]